MQEIFNIIEKLRSLSGNSQLEYLSQYKDNELLRELLLYTYDTDKKYKIQEASLEKALEAYKRQVRLSEVVLYSSVDKTCWNVFRTYLDKFSNAKGVKENEIEELPEGSVFRHAFISVDEIVAPAEGGLQHLRVGPARPGVGNNVFCAEGILSRRPVTDGLEPNLKAGLLLL